MDYSSIIKPLNPVTKANHIISVNHKSSQTLTEICQGNYCLDSKKIEAENNSLKALLKCRENEICKLKREIHKLKVSTIFESNI